MVAYSVHRIRQTAQRVVVMQYPGLDTGPVLMVAPLYPAEAKLELEVVTPRVEIGGEAFLVATHLMAAVHRGDLGAAETSLAAYEYPIAKAIHRLFFGI